MQIHNLQFRSTRNVHFALQNRPQRTNQSANGNTITVYYFNQLDCCSTNWTYRSQQCLMVFIFILLLLMHDSNAHLLIRILLSKFSKKIKISVLKLLYLTNRMLAHCSALLHIEHTLCGYVRTVRISVLHLHVDRQIWWLVTSIMQNMAIYYGD